MSSSNWSGNFGYSVQTTRRERHIIAQRNWNKPLLQQMKRPSWRSTLTNEIAAALWSHARRVQRSSGNVAAVPSTICLLFAF